MLYLIWHFVDLGIMNFRKMLDKYKQQRRDIDKIASSQMLGLFCVKLNPLKNVVKPTCEYLLELVEKTMVKYVHAFWTNRTCNTIKFNVI